MRSILLHSELADCVEELHIRVEAPATIGADCLEPLRHLYILKYIKFDPCLLDSKDHQQNLDLECSLVDGMDRVRFHPDLFKWSRHPISKERSPEVDSLYSCRSLMQNSLNTVSVNPLIKFT